MQEQEKNKTTLKEIQQAKDLLKNNGYYVNDLWHVLDVKYVNDDEVFNCDNDEALKILNTVLSSNHVIEIINNKIRFEVYQYS